MDQAYRGDLANYNDWYAQRQREKGDLPRGLSNQVRDAVHQDYSDPQFHERLWHTMIEYVRRVSEDGD